MLQTLRSLNMKEGDTKDPLLYLSLWREWGLQRPDTAAGQARIPARDKTGNRKETTQTPALPNVTGPLFIFQEERKKNNINNITCSEGKWMRGKGGLKEKKWLTAFGSGACLPVELLACEMLFLKRENSLSLNFSCGLNREDWSHQRKVAQKVALTATAWVVVSILSKFPQKKTTNKKSQRLQASADHTG